MRQFILDENNNPVPTDLMGWANWMEGDPKKRIIKQEDVRNLWVSTVFLGLDHNWGEGPPILFETMIFNGKGKKKILDTYEEYQERCCTYDEALKMHAEAVKFAKYRQTWKGKLSRLIHNWIHSISDFIGGIRGSWHRLMRSSKKS